MYNFLFSEVLESILNDHFVSPQDMDNNVQYKDGVLTLNLAGTKKEDIKVKVQHNILMVNDRKFRIGQQALNLGDVTYKNGLLTVKINDDWEDVKVD